MTGFVDAFTEFSQRKANRVNFMNDALMGMQTADVEARDNVANELTTWRQEFTNDVNDLTTYAGTVEGKMDAGETAVQQADDVINTKETTFNLGKAKFERKRELLA